MWTILRPIVWHKSLTDGPTSGSWSKLLSLGTTRILRALAVFREYVLRGVYVLRVYSQYFDVLFVLPCEREKTFILRECIFYVLDFTLPVTKIMSQPRAPFCTYVYPASIGLIAASHLFSINIDLPVYPLLYYCSSNDPTLLPQTVVHSLSSKMCVCSSRY